MKPINVDAIFIKLHLNPANLYRPSNTRKHLLLVFNYISRLQDNKPPTHWLPESPLNVLSNFFEVIFIYNCSVIQGLQYIKKVTSNEKAQTTVPTYFIRTN
jgi:hypothetical protein